MLTMEQYKTALEAGEIDESQLYLTPNESENFVIAENPEVVFPTEVVNADTLDGYEAEDFAKSEDLTALQTTIDTEVTNKLNSMPTIHTSTVEPTAADGKNGDIWIVYETE